MWMVTVAAVLGEGEQAYFPEAESEASCTRRMVLVRTPRSVMTETREPGES